jgi:hypothetical protein
MLLLAGCSITVTNASDDETITSVGLAKFGTNDEGNSILLPGTTITNGTLAPGESVSESFLSPGTYRIVVEYLDSRGDDRAEFENREVRLLDPFQQWDWPGSGN